MFEGVCEYVVVQKKQETPTTATLTLEKTDGTVPLYRPGQCLTVYFPDLSRTLGKQYSISSAPCEKKLSITVKAMGRFSNRLCALSFGSRVHATAAHGTFAPSKERTAVLLAGGMGITPFRGLMVEAASQGARAPMHVLYSCKTSLDMPFEAELYELSRQHPSLQLDRFVTNDSMATSRGVKRRRMRFDDIDAGAPDAEYLISGSLDYVLGLKNMLIEGGVDRAHILTESYF